MSDDEFAGHTPGPWRVELSADDEWARGAWDLVVGDGRTRMVLASRAPWGSRSAESTANGNLVAAAPRLLRERDDARARVALLERELAHIRDQVAASMRAAGVAL